MFRIAHGLRAAPEKSSILLVEQSLLWPLQLLPLRCAVIVVSGNMSVNGRPFRPDPYSFRETGTQPGDALRYYCKGVIRTTR